MADALSHPFRDTRRNRGVDQLAHLALGLPAGFCLQLPEHGLLAAERGLSLAQLRLLATQLLLLASEGLLTLGGIADGIAFNAVLEAVATKDNVSIISQPKIAVREGGRADIVNNQRIPFLQISALNPSGGFNATVDYITVGVSLFVVPRVVGTKTVALNIDIEASQQTGTVTTAVNSDQNSTTVVPSPVVSTRSARTIVYLQPGQAVILGGLLTERSVENERKVPILGDIPILGHLFKSTFLSKEQTNVLFFIRPRILQGSDLNREF